MKSEIKVMYRMTIGLEGGRAVPVPFQQQRPQIGIGLPEKTELVYTLIVAKPTPPPCCRGIDRGKQAVLLTPLPAVGLFPADFNQG